jgi:hypothetical protein
LLALAKELVTLLEAKPSRVKGALMDRLPRTTKEECPRCQGKNVWHVATGDALHGSSPPRTPADIAGEVWQCRDCEKGFVREPPK